MRCQVYISSGPKLPPSFFGVSGGILRHHGALSISIYLSLLLSSSTVSLRSSAFLSDCRSSHLLAKLITKNTFQKELFCRNSFRKITRQSLYKANSFACSLANRDKAVAATLPRKMFWWNDFVIVTKNITKTIVPRNIFVIVSAGMVSKEAPTVAAMPPATPSAWLR